LAGEKGGAALGLGIGGGQLCTADGEERECKPDCQDGGAEDKRQCQAWNCQGDGDCSQ
jgi:hypothetical protein